jgi:DNA-binding NarL/FixJ family response regulator
VKSASVTEIAEAVRSVSAGRAYFSKEVASRFVATDKTRVARLQKLTSREREVLRCVARDLSGKEIAQELGLSVRTVDRHKANIMEKLGIHSQVGLTLYAIAEGMSDPRATLEVMKP